MKQLNWIMFSLFLVGLLAFVGAAFAGLSAVEYEYTHETTTSNLTAIENEIGSYSTITYEEMTDEDRATVEEIITEGSIVVETHSDTALRFGNRLVVNEGEDYHVIERSTVLDWSSTGGIAAVALALGGVILIAEAFRRQYF